MEMYVSNNMCPCIRCRMNCMMGPAVLVTFGTMLLLRHLTDFVHGGTIVAVMLIVIGGVKLLQSSASTDGHRQLGTLPASAIPPVPPASPADSSTIPNEVQNG